MGNLVGLVLLVSLSAGAFESGKDLLEIVTRLSKVATERMTMAQIGKVLLLEQVRLGRKVTPNELPDLLRKELTRGGFDPTADIWGTPYYLSGDNWRTLPLGPEQFVLVSAGPDKIWWTVDDLLWANFMLPDKYLFAPDSAKDATAASSELGRAEKALSELVAKLEARLGKGANKSGGQ